MTLQLGITIAVGVFQMLLMALGTMVWARDRERREDLARLTDKVQKLEADMPRQYVLKDDYVRAMVGFERQQNRMVELITEVRDAVIQHIGKEEHAA